MGGNNMYNEFMTKEMMANFAGLVASVSIIVQFTKVIVKKQFGDIGVRIYTIIVALILNFIFTDIGTDVQEIALAVINSILVAITSMGGYEIIADPRAEKQKKSEKN